MFKEIIMESIYSVITAIKGLNTFDAYKTKAEFPKGFTPKFECFVEGVCKSFPYWTSEGKAQFKARVKQGLSPLMFDRLREKLEALVGVVTLKDMAKTTTKPDIMAELVKLSKGIESLRAELAKVFAEKAKEIETPKPKAKKKAKAIVVAEEEELFPL